MTRKKLCYVLPKYDVDAPEHFFHIYRLLEELAKYYDLTVLVEKFVGKKVIWAHGNVVTIKTRFFPLRLFETFWKVLCLRLHGYKAFYVHYSYFGMLAAAFATRLLGGKTFYWNCGLPHLFFKPLSLRSKFENEWPLKVSLALTHYLVTGTVYVNIGA